MIEIAFREPFVVQGHNGSRGLGFELKLNDRVDARTPMRGTPRLYDALVGDQLDISTDDLSSEQGKGSPRFGVDLGRQTRECRELLCIQKHLINALRASL